MQESIYSQYETDTESEETGKWVEFRGGARIRVRSDNSTKARNWYAATAKKQRNLIASNGGILPPKLSDQNDIDLLTEALISGWDPVTILDRSGQEIPFTKENVRQLMTDLPSLRRDILYIARSDETFRSQAEEAAKESMKGN